MGYSRFGKRVGCRFPSSQRDLSLGIPEGAIGCHRSISGCGQELGQGDTHRATPDLACQQRISFLLTPSTTRAETDAKNKIQSKTGAAEQGRGFEGLALHFYKWGELISKIPSQLFVSQKYFAGPILEP